MNKKLLFLLIVAAIAGIVLLPAAVQGEQAFSASYRVMSSTNLGAMTQAQIRVDIRHYGQEPVFVGVSYSGTANAPTPMPQYLGTVSVQPDATASLRAVITIPTDEFVRWRQKSDPRLSLDYMSPDGQPREAVVAMVKAIRVEAGR